ncbi:hypothetical protein EBZ38_13615 [bacterium]|nr:hypothetical protein [bacterium]
MELLEKISSPEQASYAGLWQSVQAVAYQRLRRDIQTALFKSAQAQLDQVLFQTSKQFVDQWQTIDPLPMAPEYRGTFISINGSKYLGLRIKQLYVYNSGFTTVTGVEWRIVQTQDGKILDSGTYDMVPGMNYVPVNQVFYSDFDKVNIVILVDCTNLDTLQGNFVDYGWNQMDIECATRFTYLWRNGWYINPVTVPLSYMMGTDWGTGGSNSINGSGNYSGGYGSYDNWTSPDNQSGVYVDAQLLCSLDSFVCYQKEFLLDAWASLLCYYILWNKLASPRANYFAQGQREFTQASMQQYLAEYTDSLAIWGRQLNLKAEGLCFDCEQAGLIQQGSQRP